MLLNTSAGTNGLAWFDIEKAPDPYTTNLKATR